MNNLTFEARLCLQKSIKSFYNRLKIDLSEIQKQKLGDIQGLKIELSEHALLFPWLGIYRIPLMLSKHLSSDSLGIFVINDHVHRREQPWTRDLSIYFRGNNSNNQKNPIVMKCDRKRPLYMASIPSPEEISRIFDKIKGKISQNIIWYESLNNYKISHKQKAKISNNLNFLTNLLQESRNNTKTYSDWLAFFNINLIQHTNPDLYDNVLFVSFSDIMAHSKNFKRLFIDNSKSIVNSINSTIDYQKKSNLIPYKDNYLREDYISFWLYCPKCHARNRGSIIQKGQYTFSCGSHFHYEGDIENSELFTAFDVISIEVFTSFLNLSKRIVGSIKNYSLAVDNVTKDVFGIEPPLRVPLTTLPVFRGIGTEKEGCLDATVFSALIEVEPEILGKFLVTEWQDTPIINATS